MISSFLFETEEEIRFGSLPFLMLLYNLKLSEHFTCSSTYVKIRIIDHLLQDVKEKSKCLYLSSFDYFLFLIFTTVWTVNIR